MIMAPLSGLLLNRIGARPMAVAGTLCVASGILISRVALPYLGIGVQPDPAWDRLHTLTAEITLGLVPMHVALRWRWILRVGRRLVGRRTARPPA